MFYVYFLCKLYTSLSSSNIQGFKILNNVHIVYAQLSWHLEYLNTEQHSNKLTLCQNNWQVWYYIRYHNIRYVSRFHALIKQWKLIFTLRNMPSVGI